MKLLRVLEEMTFEPLGSIRSEKTDARIITATNHNLEDLVRDNVFRSDLYYRINIVNIHLPPLRDRMEDIPLLVNHFVDKFNRLQNKRVLGVSDDVLEIFLNYGFPGNIRELQNFIERGFVICQKGWIEQRHLPNHLIPSHDGALMPANITLEDMEKLMIQRALQRHDGNRLKAAEDLGIHRSTLHRKMIRYAIILDEAE